MTKHLLSKKTTSWTYWQSVFSYPKIGAVVSLRDRGKPFYGVFRIL